MKILAAEITLREETRELQQAKPQVRTDEFSKKAKELTETQSALESRVGKVIEKIRQLPDGESSFAKEIKQLISAGTAMTDAVAILAVADTGPNAIAAQTEAIEWLLRAKRSKGGGGGGGGAPGGGNRKGDATSTAALALLGQATDASAKIAETEVLQSTGKSEKTLPEEYQRGLGQYFEMLEKRK